MGTPSSELFVQQLFQQAIRAYEAGNRPQAVVLAKRVLERQSNHAGALYLVGSAALDDNQAAQSLPCLEAAARLDGRHPGIQRALGLAYLSLERWAPAAERFQRALEQHPQDSGLLNNLGIAYKELGDIEAAVQCYRKALNFNQNDAAVYNNLAIALDKQRDYNAAIEAYRRSVALNPKNPAIWSNLAILFEQGNHLEEAEAAAAHGLALAPDHAGLNLTAAKCTRRRGNPEGAIRSLERILTHTHPRQEARRAIEFELGRNCDALNNTATAFQHFKTANQLTVEIWPGSLDDAAAFVNELERLLEWFTASRAKDWYLRSRPSPPSSPHPLAFLVGFLRTGSTLMDTLLSARPEVAVLEEESCLEDTLNRLRRGTPPYPQSLDGLDSKTWNSLRTDYWQSVARCVPQGGSPHCVLDKNPLMSAHAGYIHAMFPDARFLFALRHPYDVVLSCYMQTFDGSTVRGNFVSLESSARAYDRVMQLWRRYGEIFELQICELRYESLVADPQPTLNTAFKFMGISEPAPSNNFSLNTRLRGRIYTPSYHQVVEPVSARAVNRWQRYSGYFGEALGILRPWVKRFGYTL